MSLDLEQHISEIALPDELRERCKEVVRRRVNEARSALGEPEYDDLEPCEPNNACACLLGHHLKVSAQMVVVRFDTEHDARVVAEAWSSKANGYYVTLPTDLQVATAAFDAGQLPELIEEIDVLDESDLAEEVSPERVERALVDVA